MQSSTALSPSFSGGSDTRNVARFAETHGAELRRRIGASPDERLDLDAMMREFQVVLYKLTDIMNVSAEAIAHLQSISPRRWSGGGQALPNGHLLVILHPFQTQERANITLMEEICHHYFGHQPTRIETNEFSRRSKLIGPEPQLSCPQEPWRKRCTGGSLTMRSRRASM